MADRIHWRKRRRLNAMLWAYLTFAAKKLAAAEREVACWAYLMEWARLGGQPDEVPGA